MPTQTFIIERAPEEKPLEAEELLSIIADHRIKSEWLVTGVKTENGEQMTIKAKTDKYKVRIEKLEKTLIILGNRLNNARDDKTEKYIGILHKIIETKEKINCYLEFIEELEKLNNQIDLAYSKFADVLVEVENL